MASGQWAPHQQVEHMVAPTDAQCIKKTLANGEPSTHGASRHFALCKILVAFGVKPTCADWQGRQFSESVPQLDISRL